MPRNFYPVEGEPCDLQSLLDRVKEPGATFKVGGFTAGHVIAVTEAERDRLETFLLIALSGDEPSPDLKVSQQPTASE